MGRGPFLAGVLLSLPFTLSVALLCTTSGSDGLYRALSVATLGAVYAVLFGMQVACGVRAYRGARLARPLAAWTTAYMAGVFAAMLAGDVAIRLFEPRFLPAGLAGTVALWAEVLAPMAALAALSAITVAVGVAATRDRLRAVAARR